MNSTGAPPATPMRTSSIIWPAHDLERRRRTRALAAAVAHGVVRERPQRDRPHVADLPGLAQAADRVRTNFAGVPNATITVSASSRNPVSTRTSRSMNGILVADRTAPGPPGRSCAGRASPTPSDVTLATRPCRSRVPSTAQSFGGSAANVDRLDRRPPPACGRAGSRRRPAPGCATCRRGGTRAARARRPRGCPAARARCGGSRRGRRRGSPGSSPAGPRAMLKITSGSSASVISENDSCMSDEALAGRAGRGARAGRQRAPRHADGLELDSGVDAHAADLGQQARRSARAPR